MTVLDGMWISSDKVAKGVDAMAQKEEPNLMFPEMVDMRKKRVQDFVNAQTELLDKLQETNRQWFDRLQSEASFVSDFR